MPRQHTLNKPITNAQKSYPFYSLSIAFSYTNFFGKGSKLVLNNYQFNTGSILPLFLIYRLLLAYKALLMWV